MSVLNPLRPLLVALLFGMTTPVFAADYDTLVAQAREQIQGEHYIEGLATAKDAVRANPNDYKAHYYVSLAYLSLGRFEDADVEANSALKLAPTAAKPGVEKLLATLNERRQGSNAIEAADTALADGMTAKAARLYEQAWTAGRNHPEYGLKAADLYANRLDKPLDAARVLRQVKAAGGNTASRADEELKKLAAPLRQIAQTLTQQAKQQSGAAALASLQQAEAADPDYVEIYQLRARIVAAGEDRAALQAAIRDLARRNLAQAGKLAGLPRMAQWLQQPAFNEYMLDMLGDEQLAKLRRLAQQAVDAPAAGTLFKDCPECPPLVVIPTGEFDMGSNDGEAREKPLHSVTVDSFAIGQTEVTQGQWRALMGNNPSEFNKCGDNCPVERVSWDDAQAYIRKLNQKTGKQYRLPSEAEWEYACRAGGKQTYCGSNDLASVGWYNGNSGNTTHAVGQKQANAWGLYDMSGNIWEWLEDSWHDNYTGAPMDGSAWQGDGTHRLLRGGGWATLHSSRARRIATSTIQRYGSTTSVSVWPERSRSNA